MLPVGRRHMVHVVPGSLPVRDRGGGGGCVAAAHHLLLVLVLALPPGLCLAYAARLAAARKAHLCVGGQGWADGVSHEAAVWTA
jgi:hypothetical protein